MDILGIGNALLDIFSFSDEDLALRLALHPNRAAHVAPERLDELLLAVPNPIFVSGGTAGNALKAARLLGLSCAFVGCVGTEDREDDRWASLFASDLEASGVSLALERRTRATGRCLVIHMPGGMKSIACSPGAAPTIDPEQITQSLIKSASQIFVDGQTIRNREVFEKIERLCRELAVPLAVDVASADIARGECAAIARILSESGATVFLNEDEAFTLAAALEPTVPKGGKRRDAEETADAVFSFYARSGAGTATIVMKRGEHGARCWTAAGRDEAATEAVGIPLDDTGAGDVFAGAFLAARLAGLPTARSLEAGNEAARACISVPGSRLDPEAFASLHARLDRARNNPQIN